MSWLLILLLIRIPREGCCFGGGGGEAFFRTPWLSLLVSV
jgi:hypothetical protein